MCYVAQLLHPQTRVIDDAWNAGTEEKDQKCRMCTAMNGDPASLRQEIVRLHTALRANLQELCVVRSMAYILNPSLQFQLSNMAACTQDLTAAEVCPPSHLPYA